MSKVWQSTIIGTLLAVSSNMVLAQPNLSQNAENTAAYVMDIQMTPAVCNIHTVYSNRRKCLEGYSLHIAGLYPLIKKQDCKTNKQVILPLLQKKVISKIMPDEKARLVLWQNVGGCTGITAQQYFRLIANNANALKLPFNLSSSNTRVTKLTEIQQTLFELNPELPPQAVHFQCQNHQNRTYLISIKVCYETQGKYQKCPSHIKSNCPERMTIKGVY